MLAAQPLTGTQTTTHERMPQGDAGQQPHAHRRQGHCRSLLTSHEQTSSDYQKLQGIITAKQGGGERFPESILRFSLPGLQQAPGLVETCLLLAPF